MINKGVFDLFWFKRKGKDLCPDAHEAFQLYEKEIKKYIKGKICDLNCSIKRRMKQGKISTEDFLDIDDKELLDQASREIVLYFRKRGYTCLAIKYPISTGLVLIKIGWKL